MEFPQSPQLSALEVAITWRPLPPEYMAPHNPAEIDKQGLIQSIEFDLSKSLKEQLEKVKHQVIIAQRRLKKQGSIRPFTIAGKKELWMLCLKWLDDRSLLLPPPVANKETQSQKQFDSEQITLEAEFYLSHYLNILTLMEK